MKAIITSTPEVELELINSVCEILSASIGPISFQIKSPLGSEILELIVDNYKSPETINLLTTDDLFNICSLHRKNAKLDNSDFLILLTSIRTPEDWLSLSDGNNFFVDINDWEEYSNIKPQYGIAHQIVASIFHTFIKYESLNVLDEESTHSKSIGCLMDFCDDRTEVMYKLRAGYICPECIKKAISRGMTKEILVQLHTIIQKLRAEFVEFELLQSMVTPLQIHVDKQLNIMVGDVTIQLEALPKTLYMYFLEMNHAGGIIKDSLNNIDTKNALSKIYRRLNKGAEVERVYSLCLEDKQVGTTFMTNKSIVNTKIKKTLGEQLSPFYIVGSSKENGVTVYKLAIAQEYINLEYLK